VSPVIYYFVGKFNKPASITSEICTLTATGYVILLLFRHVIINDNKDKENINKMGS